MEHCKYKMRKYGIFKKTTIQSKMGDFYIDLGKKTHKTHKTLGIGSSGSS